MNFIIKKYKIKCYFWGIILKILSLFIMKKLFLASIACNVLDKFVEIFNCSPQNLKVAFITTAANVYENKLFLDDDRNKLLKLWFKVFDIDIADKNEQILEKQFKDIDIIFVAWGNTFYLLEKIFDSGFDKIIKEFINNSKYYIGSSAGSVIAGSSIEIIKWIDNLSKTSNLESFEGLNLINKIILPHYGNKKYQEKINQTLKNYSDFENDIIKLNDNQAIIVIDNEIKIISS